MANIAIVADSTAGLAQSIQQHTAPCGVDIPPRSAVKFDASGNFTLAKATNATEAAAFYGVSTNVKTIKAGYPVTAIKRGLMDGFNFTQAYGTSVYLSDTDGRLADVAGTVSVKIGTIAPAFAQPIGTAADKLLSVEL